MAMEYKEDTETNTIELVIDGRVTEDDYNRVISQLEAFIEAQPDKQIKILEIIKNYDGFDFAVLGKGIKFDIDHHQNYKKCAVVSNSGWIGPFSRFVGMFLACDIRTFKLNEVDQAKDWLQVN